MSLRDHILNADDLKREYVEIPEWDCGVFVRVLTGTEYDDFQMRLQVNGEVSMENFRAKLVALCACDENGEAIFTEADVPALAKKGIAGMERIVNKAMKINRIGKSDVEEMVKN